MDDSSAEAIARWHALFAEFPDAFLILTREAQVLDVNQAGIDLLGYKRKEIVGMDAARLLGGGPDALHRFQNHMERDGWVKDHNMQLRRKDGKQIDCMVTAAAWPDQNGPRGYMTVVRDVTAGKETERSLGSLLRMSEELNSQPDLDSLLDRLVEQLLELTGAEGGCAGWRTSQGMSCDHFFQGPEVVQLTYDCPSGVGWAGWLLQHGSPYVTNDAAHDPVIAPEVRERLGVRSGMAIPIVDGQKDVIAFFEVYNKRGAAGFSDTDLEHGIAAAQIASLAIHNRLLQRNLAALAAFSQSLTGASDFDQILEVVGGHLEATFKRRCVILLRDNGGLIPRFRNADIVFSEAERAAAVWSWEHGQDAGHSTDIMSGAQARYLPLKVRGEVIGVLGLEVTPGAWFSRVQRQLFSAFINQAALAIERGLQEQKARRLRFLEESDKVKDAVLSAVSHDVRTPLAAIAASLSGLLTSGGALDPAAERQLLETADMEARRLHRLVNNLLNMTRLEIGASSVRTEPCDLLDVVSAALEQLGASAGQRQVSCDIAEDLPLIPMDFGLITCVFINLLSNAFKYSAPGQPVQVRGRIVDDRLEVLVIDTGVGVPAEDLGRVFDKFYRAAESGPSTGLGLGLAICKAFIEAHNGQISLEHNPAGGTIARFSIPSHQAATPGENPQL